MELFDYDPSVGTFVRRVAKRPAKAGDVAGCVDPSGYLRINVDGKLYWAHRLAWMYMTGAMPSGVIDHINQNKADNRFSNLRDTTYGLNNRNCGPKRHNKTGVVGVAFDNQKGCWASYARQAGKKIHLYYGDDFIEAVCRRKSWEAANPVFP
jgi:hypothetical protein